MGSAKDTRRVVTDEDAKRISRVEELSYELKIEQVGRHSLHRLVHKPFQRAGNFWIGALGRLELDRLQRHAGPVDEEFLSKPAGAY